MRVGHLRAITASFIVSLVALLVLSGIPGLTAAYTPNETGTRQGELILKVGGQDEMKTRNLLPASANDVWTSDVQFRIYDSVLRGHPVKDEPMAYIAKGVDYDEDGMFDISEYNTWKEQTGAVTPLEIVVYYDFNGVYWHDDTPMSVWDMLFSYHIAAMNARFNTDLRILFPGGTTSTYEGGGRQMNIAVVTKNWEGEGTMTGDSAERFAIRFTLTESFALFYDSSLFPVMLPMHEWSRTGGGRHGDFGCAVWIPTAEATAKGIPECGNADPAKWGKGIASTETVTGSHPYTYSAAEAWELRDQDMIGNGPFKFVSWIPGVQTTVTRFEDYFVGVDPKDPTTVYDANLVAMLKKPTIEGIRFLVYKTTQLGVFALQNGDVDFYHWNVGAEFVPDLLKVPQIAVESNAEPGFFYMAYNMRRDTWGYVGGDPTTDGPQGGGYWLRQAISHLVDKKSIVQNLLQNFGVIGHGYISPSNTFWYNDAIPKPEFDLLLAKQILDDPNKGGRAGVGPDPAGPCSKSTPTGCRTIPLLGNGVFYILTPQADYDPVRASSGLMVAEAMRAVGLNAEAKPTSFGEIVNKMNARDFDVYILGWRIGGTDPDYLFSFFHSSNAVPGGQNHPGFNNATFDQVITDSRKELTRSVRQGMIFQAQALLSDARPYDILYYRTNIEGYRQDRFVNWTVSSGTIWGFWSLQGIRPPSSKAIRASITTESATSAGSTEIVTVTVFDDQSRALSGATVTLSVGVGPDQGNLSVGATVGKTVSDVTDLNGKVEIQYHAADVTSPTQVLIDATATHPDFPDPSVRSAVIRVFPPGAQFLSLRVVLPNGDRVTAGSNLPMEIGVKDQDGAVVGDAVVAIAVEPAGDLVPDPAGGAAQDMGQVTLSAASTVVLLTTYSVTVGATKATYAAAESPLDVTIVPVGGGTKICPDGSRVPIDQQCPTVSTPALDVLPILGGIGVVAIVAGIMSERKRRS